MSQHSVAVTMSLGALRAELSFGDGERFNDKLFLRPLLHQYLKRAAAFRSCAFKKTTVWIVRKKLVAVATAIREEDPRIPRAMSTGQGINPRADRIGDRVEDRLIARVRRPIPRAEPNRVFRFETV